MVSTRRTAAIKDSDHDMAGRAGLALRKKPVRRATATKAEPLPATMRTTRKRKDEPAPETGGAVVGGEDDELAESEAPALAPTSKPTVRKMTGRPRTIEAPRAPQIQPAKALVAPARTTRSTRTTGARVKKRDVLVEDVPELQPPVLAKADSKTTARQTRGAVTRATPLSPKKVTQVAEPRTRLLRTGNQKTADANLIDPVTKGRATTRRRAISDENASVLDLPGDEGKVCEERSPPARHTSSNRRPVLHEPGAPSEASMSSRPTTPSHSPALSLGNVQDESEIEQDEAEEQDSGHVIQQDDENLEVSDDELAGPKTPMKRSSPGSQARYFASVQKTIYHLNDIPEISPPRNLRSTPKTLKPPTRSAYPTLIARRGTVAAGRTHDSAFRELQILQADSYADTEIEPTDITHADDSLLLDTPYRRQRVSSIASSLTEEDSIMVDGTIPGTYLINAGIGQDMVGDSTRSAGEQQNDTNIVDEDAEHEAANDTSSCGSEDTVLVNRMTDASISMTMEDNELAVEADFTTSSTPQTMIWENLRDDVTIPIDFDMHFAGIRSLPQLDRTERLSISMDLTDTNGETKEEEGNVQHNELETPSPLATPGGSLPGSVLDRRSTLDTFNDFVDIAALSESTRMIQIDDDDDHERMIQSESSMSLTTPAPLRTKQDTKNLPEAETLDEPASECHVPHYALPTFSFDARRKSLPATSMITPVRFGMRPHTSDGASMPRLANPAQHAWWARVAGLHASPIGPRASTACSMAAVPRSNTPSRQSLKYLRHATPSATPGERYSRMGQRQGHAQQFSTVAGPTRFYTPTSTSVKRPSTAQKSSISSDTPRLFLKSRLSHAPRVSALATALPDDADSFAETGVTDMVATPVQTPGQRFPRLHPRAHYEDHAQTAAVARFKTPIRSSAKRPATAAKAATSRKVAFAADTPMKSPLRAPGMTPGQAPMTPHPAAPLRGVVALVEVFTIEGASASAPFMALLQRLGAKPQKTWSERITHVVFKDGSPRTLQKLRLHNQTFEEDGKGHRIHCVNSRWVSDCDAAGSRADETDEAYAVDPTIIPRGGSRRRKSMEPYALVEIGGNVVRDRKSSLGRQSLSLSLSRSSMKSADSPTTLAEENSMATPDVHRTTPKRSYLAYKENSDVEEQSSPATPAWLHPEQLVQQTAPMDRVRKLELKGTEQAKNRRLTFWNGGA